MLAALGNIKKVQGEINKEYDELINLKLYKEDVKSDIQELKGAILNLEQNIADKFNDSISEIKEEIYKYHKLNESKQEEIKEKLRDDIILELKEILEIRN